MDLLFTIFSFIFLISIIVGIHELGHFLTARFCNIHVLKFKIGFGKELFSYKDNKDCTRYEIRLEEIEPSKIDCIEVHYE